MTEGDDLFVGVNEQERFVFERALKAAVRVVSNFLAQLPSVSLGPLKNALSVLKVERAKDEPILVHEAVTRT